MTSALDPGLVRAGRLSSAPPSLGGARVPRARVALVQTQAENGGAQEVARLLATGLAAKGYATSQIFFFRKTPSFEAAAETYFCASTRPAGPLRFLRFLLGYFVRLRTMRPDVVITFQHYGNIIGAPIARLAGVRHVVANQTTTLDALHPAIRRADRILGQTGTYDLVVMNSAATGNEHAGHPRSYRDRIVHIPHGFECKTSPLAKPEARRTLGLPLDVTLIGGVGRLHPTKNWEAAIRLLPARPLWQLAIAGQGADGERLQGLATSLGCADRVHFVGELPPSRIGTFLAGLDVFVFPSLAETFGLAVVEAAQAGVPVVANHLPVLREVLSVAGEPCAVFADVADIGALVAAVDRVLEPDVARVLVARGMRLDRVYALDRMVDDYADVIDRLMDGRGAKERSAAA